MSLCEIHTVKSFASIARTLELFFAVMFLSRSISFSSTYFPAALELCRFFFRRMCVVLVSHRFAFFLGNLIVITLFIKSSRSTCRSSDDEEEDLIGQFVTPNATVSSEETVSVEKDVIIPTEAPLASGGRNPEERKRRRTRSEDFGAKVAGKIQFRRPGTEAGLETEKSGEESRTNVEDLSNEEFHRKVEEFIVRQQMFLREESLSIAVANRKSFSV